MSVELRTQLSCDPLLDVSDTITLASGFALGGGLASALFQEVSPLAGAAFGITAILSRSVCLRFEGHFSGSVDRSSLTGMALRTVQAVAPILVAALAASTLGFPLAVTTVVQFSVVSLCTSIISFLPLLVLSAEWRSTSFAERNFMSQSLSNTLFPTRPPSADEVILKICSYTLAGALASPFLLYSSNFYPGAAFGLGYALSHLTFTALLDGHLQNSVAEMIAHFALRFFGSALPALLTSSVFGGPLFPPAWFTITFVYASMMTHLAGRCIGEFVPSLLNPNQSS